MKLLFAPAILLCIAGPCLGRLGETPDQCQARYGLEKPHLHERGIVLLEGAREATFLFKGWLIRVAFVPATDGKLYAVRERYSKRDGGAITPLERDAILEAESAGAKWEQSAPANLTGPEAAAAAAMPDTLQSLFRRTDGAEAAPTLTGMDLQLPQAVKFEQEARAIRERKERSKLPKF